MATFTRKEEIDKSRLLHFDSYCIIIFARIGL